MLAGPRRCEILPLAIQDKFLACLATCFDVQKSVIQSVIKLDQPIVQYGRVSRLEGGDLMIGRHFVNQTAEDSRDASFIRVSFAFFQYQQPFHIIQLCFPFGKARTALPNPLYQS